MRQLRERPLPAPQRLHYDPPPPHRARQARRRRRRRRPAARQYNALASLKRRLRKRLSRRPRTNHTRTVVESVPCSRQFFQTLLAR